MAANINWNGDVVRTNTIKSFSVTACDRESESKTSVELSSNGSGKFETINSTLRHACRVLENNSLELRKQCEDLRRSLRLHRKLARETTSKPDKCGIKLVQEKGQCDVADSTKKTKESVHVLYKHLPNLNKRHIIHMPPEPKVKRLKGELAKYVGRKIDGCNFNILNPNSGDYLPKPSNKYLVRT